MPKNLVVIFNPSAGTRRRARLHTALDLLYGLGVQFQLMETRARGDAEKFARLAAEENGIVVAAGGDVTIAEVAAGLVGTQAMLGILPLGTANVFALEMSVPLNPPEAARALLMGRSTCVYPGILKRGSLKDRLFIQMVGVGLDSVVVHHLPLGLKRVFGKGAYVLQTLRDLTCYPFRSFRVQIDGNELEASGLVVTKGRYYAGRFQIAPQADPRDSYFHVVSLQQNHFMDALKHAVALGLGQLPYLSSISLQRGHDIQVFGADLPVQADGDDAGCLPIHIVPFTQPLRVVVP
ncbi:MAG: diacylglycerol kinase family lipid kinase [Roseomonas sp.]|nr:diacylglycerol kinase family lipid kinase [Roseomonas sp.]